MTLSRRKFLATTAAFSCSGNLFASTNPGGPFIAQPHRAMSGVAMSGFAMSGPTTNPNPREPLTQLRYDQVKLTGGPLGAHYDAMHAHYLSLSNDRLLKVYRQRAGMSAPGADMGGWYDTNGFVPGSTLGQYISGLARIGASTGDAACHAKVHALVSAFAETLGPKNQSIVRPDTNLWVCYTLDKHFAGLIDAATLSNMPEAKPLLTRVLEGSQSLLPPKGRDRIGKKDPPYDETFVMPENLFSAYELTGNPAFQQLAERYMLDKELFDVLARGNDPFPGQHAYSHAIALSSAGMAYLKGRDTKYREAMEHAFTLLTTEQQFSSGGWGPNETFIHPHKGELYASLSTTPDHFETPCGSYAATKLARYLLRTTPPSLQDQLQATRHGDNLERVLFNTILAVKSPDSNGDYPYYSTYSPNADKVYYQKKWPCCSGTLVQTVADYPLNVYFQAMPSTPNPGIYVNLYTPSEAHFTHAGTPITLRQETQVPAEDTTTLTLEAPHEVDLTLYLRIPAWTAGRATIAINGKASTTASGGTWAAIHRRWRSGDKITLTLPQDFRFEPIDDQHPEIVALMRGPVQYVALNAPAGSPHLSAPSTLKPVSTQVFTEGSGGDQLTFVPLYHVANETYTSYFTRA